MNLAPVSRPSRLADEVIARLRAQITSGEWPVGSRIPTEPELVERLGVARNTVREAVRALAHNGLLDIRQSLGTYVLATSELAGVMRHRFAETDPRHVAELRSVLEATAARRRTTCGICGPPSTGVSEPGSPGTRRPSSRRTRRCT
jgi:DNA-binding FadR family transcriptional regulator